MAIVNDIRVAIDMDHNPKVRRLILELGPEAAWTLVRLWLYTARHRPDGVLTGIAVEEIEPLVGWKRRRGRLIDALERLGFIEVNGTGTSREVTIHDWPDNQPWVSGHKRRSEVGRQNALKKYINPDGTRKELTGSKGKGSADGRADASASGRADASANHPAPSPSPSPTPTPSPTPAADSLALPVSETGAHRSQVQDNDNPEDSPEARQARKAFLRQAVQKIGAEHLLDKDNGSGNSGKEGKARLDDYLVTLTPEERAMFLPVNNRFMSNAIDLEAAIIQLQADGFSEEKITGAEHVFAGRGQARG
jgi:hypothetical protein